MEKKIDNYKLDPTLKWEFAEITQVNNSNLEFQIVDEKKVKKKGVINSVILNGLFQRKINF